MKVCNMVLCASAFVAAPLGGQSLASSLGPGVSAADDVDALSKKLKDPDEKVRRQAVEDLAHDATAGAWALVLHALTDASPLVADEAQLRLGQVTDAASLKALLGPDGLVSKDVVVQLRAADAIGRLGVVVDGTALAKGLSDNDADVRCGAARAIERLAGANKIDPKSKHYVLQQLDAARKSDKDANVRAAVIPARHALEHYTVSDLFAMLSKPDLDVVRASATHTMIEIEPGQVAGLYRDSIEVEGLGPLREVVDSLVADPSASSAVALSVLLKRTTTMRARWLIADHLIDWSGTSHALDAAAWEAWARELPDTWKPNERAADRKDRKYPKCPTFFGQPVLSEHLAILVDASSWLEDNSAAGKSAKKRVQDELGKVLEGVKQAQWETSMQPATFELIMYSGSAAADSKTDEDLRPENIKHAVKYIDSYNAKGQDNFLGALSLALSCSNIDTILVLTDSSPTGARHVEEGLILEQFTQQNRFKRVFLDAVLVHADIALEERWQRFCAPSGGRVTTTKLE